MKKFLILTLLVGFATLAKAQTTGVSSLLSVLGNKSDTVTNAGTKYLTTTPIKGYQKTMVVTLVDSSLTGTLAATATLQYSTDGVHFQGFNKDSTYTLTSSTPSVGWQLTDFGWLYARVKVVGSGTQTTRIYGTFVPRKEMGGN